MKPFKRTVPVRQEDCLHPQLYTRGQCRSGLWPHSVLQCLLWLLWSTHKWCVFALRYWKRKHGRKLKEARTLQKFLLILSQQKWTAFPRECFMFDFIKDSNFKSALWQTKKVESKVQNQKSSSPLSPSAIALILLLSHIFSSLHKQGRIIAWSVKFKIVQGFQGNSTKGMLVNFCLACLCQRV